MSSVTSVETRRSDHLVVEPAPRARPHVPRHALGLTGALALMAIVAGLVTFAVDGVLTGPAVMNGSARGTGLVAAVVAAPALVASAWLAARGSWRAVVVWLGMAMYMIYNAFLLLLGTPLNRLFLVQVAMLGLAIATTAAIAVAVPPRDLAAHVAPSLPRRAIAGYLGTVVVLNALAWLGRVVPALVADDAPQLLDGLGVTMVPTYLQDLAFWLPMLGLAAVWMWQGRPAGTYLVGGGLAFWVVEGLTVAVDQWFGHRADPASPVASGAAVWGFAVLTVIGLAVCAVYLRHVDRAPTA